MKTLKLLFLAAAFPLIWQQAEAAPNITSVTSTGSAQAAQLTITGSGFGTKPGGAKPVHVWLEGSTSRNPHSGYSRDTTWNDISGQISPVSSGVVHGGVTNMQLKVNLDLCSISNNFNYYFEASITAGSTVFSMIDRYRTWSDVDPQNNKTFRGGTGSGSGIPDFVQSYCKDTDGVPVGCGGGSQDHSNRCFTENGGTIWDLSYQGSFPSVDSWEVNSHEWRKGNDTSTDDGLADGYWRNVRNNVLNQYGSSLPNGAGTQNVWWPFLVEFTGSGTCPADGEAEYWKNLYFDDSLSAVFISSAGAGGTCTFDSTRTFIRPAVPTAWADDSITAFNNIFQVATANGLCVTMRDQYGFYSNTVLLNATGNTSLGSFFSGATSSSMTIRWPAVGNATYNHVFDDNSDFSSPISSGLLSGQTTTFTSLNPGTTYFSQVKISTETDYNSSISSLTYRTNLSPSAGSITTSGFTISWNTVMDVTRVVDNNSDFSSPASSGVVSSANSDAITGLDPSTLYYWQIKPSTDGTGSYGGGTATTSAEQPGGGVTLFSGPRRTGGKINVTGTVIIK